MQNLLKDPRQHHVDEETVGPLDLDKVARVTAGTVHGVGTEGEWDPWRGAGGKPGEPAGSSEAALFKVGDERGDSIQGERPGPGLSHCGGREAPGCRAAGSQLPSCGASSLQGAGTCIREFV